MYPATEPVINTWRSLLRAYYILYSVQAATRRENPSVNQTRFHDEPKNYKESNHTKSLLVVQSIRETFAPDNPVTMHATKLILSLLAVNLNTAVSFSSSTPPTTTDNQPPFASNPATASLKKELYRLCEGTRNGVDATEDTRANIARVVQDLEALQPATPAPTALPLRNSQHTLLYCESQGGSSGKIGPWVGIVEQLFDASDDIQFINAVTLGPLRIELAAERKVIDDTRIKVNFRETAITAFGVELVTKPTKGSGIWTQRFVDEELRIMDTPSLFIIRREQEEAGTD